MKNFYINNKNLTCFFLLMLWCLPVLSSLGCGSMSWQKRTMISYDAAGEVLNASKPILKTLCADGTLSGDECAEARDAYNDAVSLYKLLGTTAIMAIDTDNQGSYETMQDQLMVLLSELAEFTGRR